MKLRTLTPTLAVTLTLILSACVDTTGLSKETSRPPAGNPNSAVTVVEFGDLQCPACRAAYTAINQPLLQKYGSQIRFEFHHFPLRNVHRYALDLAEASECAADQGKFWEFVDLAYVNQPDLDKNSVTKWGGMLKLDMDLYGRCTASHTKRDEVLADYSQGTQLGVQGTPTYFVNGKQVASTMEDLSAAIDAATKNAIQRL